MNVFLNSELEQLIRRKLEAGGYSNAEDVVREALQRMDEHDAWQELRDYLEPRIAEADRGEFVEGSVDDVIREMKYQGS